MVASIDISQPEKMIFYVQNHWCYCLKEENDSCHYFKEGRKLKFNKKLPSLKKTTLVILESIHLPTQRIPMQHRGTAPIDRCQTGIIKAFGGYFWNVESSKWRYNRCSYSTLNCFKAQCTVLIKLTNNYIFSEEESTSKLKFYISKLREKQSRAPVQVF